MKADNLEQSEKSGQSAKSGKGVAKETKSKASKFTREFWEKRVYRPRYVIDPQNAKRVANPITGKEEIDPDEYATVQEFWVRIKSAKERRAICLGTNNQQEAARLAAKLYGALKAKGWNGALAEVFPGAVERKAASESKTFGEHLAAVMTSKAASVKSVTLRNYLQAARKLVVMVTGDDGGKRKYDYIGQGRAKWLAKVDGTSTSRITSKLIQDAIDARVSSVMDANRKRSVQRTLAKFVRESKALFKDHAWNPFAALKVSNPAPPAYSGRINVGELVREGMKLETTDPQFLAALLLFAGAGLRRSEVDAARWGWIDQEQSTITVRASGNFVPKTPASEAPVFVDGGFITALVKLRPANATPESFIIMPELPEPPASSFYRYRAADLFDRLKAWLREKGLSGRTPLHDLRREFGSYVAQHADIFTASRQLRHSNIQVTVSHYAAQRRQIAPTMAGLLAAPKETQTVKGKE